jgi:hypothetical protein
MAAIQAKVDRPPHRQRRSARSSRCRVGPIQPRQTRTRAILRARPTCAALGSAAPGRTCRTTVFPGVKASRRQGVKASRRQGVKASRRRENVPTTERTAPPCSSNLIGPKDRGSRKPAIAPRTSNGLCHARNLSRARADPFVTQISAPSTNQKEGVGKKE